MNAGAKGVEREFADRDRHPSHPLIADPQNSLVVGRDDHFDLRAWKLADHLRDAADIFRGDVEPAGKPENMAVQLHRLADGRRINDGEHLFQITAHEGVKKCFIAVLQGA